MATPVEAPEGIVLKTATTRSTGITSISEIEVLDLLSEGPIEGLVQSEITYQGTEGSVGWDSYTETLYPNATGVLDARWLRSIYLNQVPVIDSAGRFNYQRVDITATNGNPNGEVQLNSSLSDLSISRALNERLRASQIDASSSVNKDYTKFYRIYNKTCKAVIINVKVPRLSQTNVETGDINTTYVDYKIYYRPFYSNERKNYSTAPAQQDGFFGPIQERIEGKVSFPYIRATRIDFIAGPTEESDFVGWEIKIIRTTPDSLSVYLQNQTYVDSLTEIYEDKFCYPYSAIVRSRYDAEFFASVPSRAFDTKLLKIKVPANYDTIKKTYATTGPGTTNGYWNGEFATELKWTDNPAWCYFDLLINKRYGLGEYISENEVDKFSLYQIARYCDTLVPDGYGGLEPRFTCNLLLTTREEAYKVLNDMASIFNGMTYYSNGSIYVTQDRPKTPRTYFTNSNVEKGDFNYSSSSKKARNTVAIVRFNDPKNFFQPAIEYFQDTDGIKKYGIRTTEVASFGCTSRGQAQRLGRWMILSQIRNTDTITFTAGMEAYSLRPGDVFGVYDSNRKIYRNAGRTLSVTTTPTTTTIIIDGSLNLETSKTYYFNLVTPSFDYSEHNITDLDSGDIDNIRKSFVQQLEFSSTDVSINGSGQTVISFTTPLNTTDYIVEPYQIWSIEQKESLNSVDTTDEYNRSIGINYDYFITIRVSEKENGKYEVAGVQYSENKFTDISDGLSFERSDTIVNATPETPLDLQLAIHNATTNSKFIRYVITPPNSVVGLTSYKIYISKLPFTANTVPDLIYLKQTIPAISNPAGTYYPDTEGVYYFRVYGYNDESRVYSTNYIDKNITVVDLKPIKDIKISSLTVLNSNASVTEASSPVDEILTTEISPTYSWQVGLAEGAIAPNDLYYRISFRPKNEGQPTPSNIIYYEATGLTVPYYKFEFATNAALAGGPYKNAEVIVEAHDSSFKTSAGNIIANGSVPLSENGWIANPEGYDRIYSYYNGTTTSTNINLGRVTGSANSFTNIIDTGKAWQYIDFNGGVNVLFEKNYIPTGVIGGFIYASTGTFTATDVITGRYDIVVRQFQYNNIERYAHAPAIFNPYLNFQTGWLAVSLYDTFDYQRLITSPSYYTGLNISNVVQIYATGLAHSLQVKKDVTFTNPLNYTDHSSLRINNVNGTGTMRLSIQEDSHSEVIIFSKKP